MIEKQPFVLAFQQTATELTEHRGVKAGVVEFEREGIFPIDAGPDSVSGLPVGKTFGELHDGNESQPPRRHCGLAAPGEQVSEVLVLDHSAKLIAHSHIDCAFRKGGFSDAGGFLWHWLNRAGMQAHGDPPKCSIYGCGNQYETVPENSPAVSLSVQLERTERYARALTLEAESLLGGPVRIRWGLEGGRWYLLSGQRAASRENW